MSRHLFSITFTSSHHQRPFKFCCFCHMQENPWRKWRPSFSLPQQILLTVWQLTATHVTSGPFISHKIKLTRQSCCEWLSHTVNKAVLRIHGGKKLYFWKPTKDVSKIPFNMPLAISVLHTCDVSRNATDERVSVIFTLSRDFYRSL